MIEVDVRNMQRKHGVDSARIEALGVRTLRAVGRDSAQLSIVVVSDRRIRELNRLYRGRDSATDVLAFSQLEGGGAGVHTDVMGDVVISAESAARQAAASGGILENELDLLTVHGILHLAGFDHAGEASEASEMELWTRKILGGRPR
jgi:probable rRNA maturation factor